MKFNIKLSVILSLLLVISFFATSVFAQENEVEIVSEEVTESTDVLSSDEVEVFEEEEIGEELPETEEDIKEIEEEEGIEEIEKRAMFGITRVTIGEGFVVKDDDSDAQFFRGVWIVKKFIERTANLEDIENREIEKKDFGFVVIGIAEEKEKFRIEMAEFIEESVKFNLKDNTGNVVGNMEIKPKKYRKITLWYGDLTLNSGKYLGTWDITAVSKTKIVKPRIERPAAWNIFALRKRREAKIKEEIQQRILENEGLGEFARAIKGKDLSKLEENERIIAVNTEERIRERIEAKQRISAVAKARAGLEEFEQKAFE